MPKDAAMPKAAPAALRPLRRLLRNLVTGTFGGVPVKRLRGEPGHTRDTRAHGSHRRTSQPSKPTNPRPSGRGPHTVAARAWARGRHMLNGIRT